MVYAKRFTCPECGWTVQSVKGEENMMQHLIIHRDQHHDKMNWSEEDLKSMMKDFYFGKKIQCTICGWSAMDPDSKDENLMRHLIIHREQSHPDVMWTEADMKDMMTEVTLDDAYDVKFKPRASK
jgi:predicted small metal-binding protein